MLIIGYNYAVGANCARPLMELGRYPPFGGVLRRCCVGTQKEGKNG